MDLVRKLVLVIEDNPTGFAPKDLGIEGYNKEEIGYHLYIMMEAGLIRGADVTTHGSKDGIKWIGIPVAPMVQMEPNSCQEGAGWVQLA